jgi:hypothetical protein
VYMVFALVRWMMIIYQDTFMIDMFIITTFDEESLSAF